MDAGFVENMKQWFKTYAAAFYSDDEYVDANIKLKEKHSYRTCAEMNHITDRLGLDENQKRIAYVIALLHDVGRFK